jgi:MoxR-like ATPase
LNASSKTSIESRFKSATDQLTKAKAEIGTVIFGQDHVVDHALTALLSGGHALLIGAPGLAKTVLVETLATVMGLSSSRIQCTPDLMPSDILGSEVLEESESGKRSFRFIKGPVFTQFLMADEINRASPRTQSALLQAMQEGTVSIAGKSHALPKPFHVLATQNPIEQEGTYPLPEAQLDRFLVQIDVDFPDEESERQILMATTGQKQTQAKAILKKDDLINIQDIVREIPVGDSVVDAILTVVRNLRPGDHTTDLINDHVAWAPGPRGSQGLMLAVRAKALLDGRMAPSIDDVIDIAVPVLKHRMDINFKARADGLTTDDLIRSVCKTL